MKSKLRPATDAVKSVEKRAEKALQFKNPVYVNQMRNPAEKVTDTTPTPDPPNGQASGSSNAEPPKAQLVMEEVPKGPGGKQPKLGGSQGSKIYSTSVCIRKNAHRGLKLF